jgi:sulfur relay protein TusB/DsrH
MSCLYIVSRTIKISDETLLGLLGNNDAIIFIGDGVNSLINPQSLALIKSFSGKIFYLADDAKSRAVISPNQKFIASTYLDFVELTVQFPRSITWY